MSYHVSDSFSGHTYPCANAHLHKEDRREAQIAVHCCLPTTCQLPFSGQTYLLPIKLFRGPRPVYKLGSDCILVLEREGSFRQQQRS
jgi:hypothetical protein